MTSVKVKGQVLDAVSEVELMEVMPEEFYIVP